MIKPLKRLIHPEITRFVISGILNTAIFYLIYFLLLMSTSYQIAFLFSFILSVTFSYFINTIFTFKEKIQFSKLLQFPLVYLVQYVTGAVGLWLLVEIIHINYYVAPILITIITVPITFLMSRRIIKEGNLFAKQR